MNFPRNIIFNRQDLDNTEIFTICQSLSRHRSYFKT